MRFLKKVSVTSNDTSGKIIDSFNTGDNHTVNAPSLNAVEERVQGYDNNLLFNGDFVEWFAAYNSMPSGGYPMPLGWVGENVVGAANMGLMFISGRSPILYSPLYLAAWDLTKDEFYPLCLTIDYSLNNTVKTKSITIFNPRTQSTYIVDEISEGIDLKFNTTSAAPNTGGACIRFFTSDTIPSGTGLYIRRVKLEKGSSATPFLIPSPRDAALFSALKSNFSQIGEVAGLKVFEFDGTLPTSLNVQEDITADSGYNLSILAAYAYNRTESKYYQMSMSSVVGAEYYRPQIYTFGNKARITLDSTSLNNYSGQAYKVFALGWKES